MHYVYGVWYYIYRQSGLQLPLSTRKNIHLLLRPAFGDKTLSAYKKRCLGLVQAQIKIPRLVTVLRDLEPDEWHGRWEHAAWAEERVALPYAYSDEKQPLYPLAAQCRRCGHEFIGKEAIKAPSIQNCACFWCHTGRLRLLARYPAPLQSEKPLQVMMQI